MALKWMAAGFLVAAGMMAVPAQTAAGIAIIVGHSDRERPDAYRMGYSRGFDDGFDRGKHDAQHRDGFNLWRHDRYRDGDAGYHRNYGPRPFYIRGYRNGFERGYGEAYARFDRERRRPGRRDGDDRGHDRWYRPDPRDFR